MHKGRTTQLGLTQDFLAQGIPCKEREFEATQHASYQVRCLVLHAPVTLDGGVFLCGATLLRCLACRSTDLRGKSVYHTNVMMAIGTGVAIVCADSVKDAKERQNLLTSLSK